MFYRDYLQSKHWKKRKRTARHLFKRTGGCVICHNPIFDLHHLTYKTLGYEHAKVLTPLCRYHHEEFHYWLKSNPTHNQSDLVPWAQEAGYGDPFTGKQKAKFKKYSSARLNARHTKWRNRGLTLIHPDNTIFILTVDAYKVLFPWNTKMLDYWDVPKAPYNDRIHDAVGHIISMEKYRKFLDINWFA